MRRPHADTTSTGSGHADAAGGGAASESAALARGGDGIALALSGGMEAVTQSRLTKLLSRQRHNMIADPVFTILIAILLIALFLTAPMY